jgi:WD40 repeat protein
LPPTPTPDPNTYNPVGGIKLSPSGDRLAALDITTIRIWDLATGKLNMLTSTPGLIPYPGGPYVPGVTPPRVHWSADGRLLVVFARDYGGSVWLIDPETGDHLRNLSPYAEDMALSPAANKVALRANGRLDIWAGDQGQPATQSPISRPTP